ncbi:MAG: lysophospholipid acyltransferase family protein [Thermoanaerobaculia bacterium]|nr:lysophospholipid acyltransferase family protein [Thermoanaerobaculia bacterium]
MTRTSRHGALRDRVELGAYLLLRALFRALPLSLADALGRGLGRLYRFVDRRRRRLVARNLALAFPEKPAAEREAISREVFAHFGAIAADLVRSEAAPVEELLARVEVEGLEHARAAAASGRGVFFATPHLGNWEWANLVTGANGMPVTIVARPLDNPLLDVRLTALRERTGGHVVDKKDAARTILRALRAGSVVGILGDQRARPPDAVLAPFFGRLAWTTTAIARLADRTGALILPVVCLRIGPGRYRLTYSEPIDPAALPPEEREVSRLTARVTELTESQVRAAPGQWLWLHDRWKGTPQN